MNKTPPLHSLKDLGQVSGFQRDSERLLIFLTDYLAAHGGQTPTFRVMANEIRATEEYVKSLLRHLEHHGRVHIASRSPLAIMLTNPYADDQQAFQARPGAYDRFLSAEGQRHRLARFIGAHERDFGTGPSLAQLADACGIPNRSYVSAMVDTLKKRGLVQQGDGPPHLTQQAKDLYGFKAHTIPQDTPPPAPANDRVIIVRHATKNEELGMTETTTRDKPISDARLHELMTLIGTYVVAGEQVPMQKDLAEAIGHSEASTVSRMVQEATRRGWLEHAHNSRRIRMTEEGRRLFVDPVSAPSVQAREPILPPEAATKAKRAQGKKREGPFESLDRFCRVLADWYAQGHCRSPENEWLAHRMGYKHAGKISAIVSFGIREGLLEPRAPRTQGTVRFSEKGRAKYLVEVAPEPAPAVEVAVEPTPEFDARVDQMVRDPVAVIAAAAAGASAAMPYRPTWEEPEDVALPADPTTLADFDTLDLVIELQSRGYFVTRR
jgi:SOS-response transcriptional repressor LexA